MQHASVSVLMPTYKQAHFISRALASLLAQTLADWELLIVDDGSPDETRQVVASYLSDTRISYLRLEHNCGLGYALNYALCHTSAPFIAYLPADDVYYPEHLQLLAACLEVSPRAVLAYAGLRYHYNRSTPDLVPASSLQLVQVMHRRTPDRWLERAELTTDDLERMFWSKLRARGEFAGTRRVSCEWVNHPHQRHKIMQEPLGGINTYRSYYQVAQPLRFHSTVGNFIDEVELYRRFRERPATPPTRDGLRILLVGELAYNPERVLALEERGHRLYGLWMAEPYWYNSVGPLPFGHVEDIPRQNWRAAVRDLRPDLVYALLNWQAVPFAHEVLMEHLHIPFVWHFKEGPFICLEKGTWKQLLDLYRYSDGQIYSSPQMRDWFMTVAPDLAQRGRAHVLDGDLPKADWFADPCTLPAGRPSTGDGAFHTVVPGRPIGLHPHIVGELALCDIHLHFYGDFTHGQWATWIERARALAPNHLHLHPQVNQDRWVAEFSRYDAGWLHFMKSDNEGDLRRATWDDLNYPARLATLLAAGLPVLQYDNAGALVATQTLARQLDIGIFFTTMQQLRSQLEDSARLQQLRANARAARNLFTFDHHADDLIAFFRQVMQAKS